MVYDFFEFHDFSSLVIQLWLYVLCYIILKHTFSRDIFLFYFIFLLIKQWFIMRNTYWYEINTGNTSFNSWSIAYTNHIIV